MGEDDYLEMSLREIQLAELDILKKFKSICNDLNLKYLLCSGTLIGAVRHEGFIPWDDDIDVAMPREDYEAFLEYTSRNSSQLAPYFTCHYRTDSEYIYPIIRFCNSDYKVDYHGIEGFGRGLFIDVYPLDGCGKTLITSRMYMRKCQVHMLLMSLAGRADFEQSGKGAIATAIKRAMFNYAHAKGVGKLLKKYDEMCKSKRYANNKYVAITLWADVGMREIARKAELADLIPMKFEDELFMAPKEYHLILSRHYGDYMVLPAESERVSHHNYNAYKKIRH